MTDCRRMEDAVKAIPESSDLCKNIVLGHNVNNIPGNFNMFCFLCYDPTSGLMYYCSILCNMCFSVL